MKTYELSGTPRELGREFADRVLDRANDLQEVSPEPLDPPPNRVEFARQCEPLVAEHVPQLLEELDGIADRLERSREEVRAVALALDHDPGCSLLAVGPPHTDGETLFGRNHDFRPSFRPFSKLFHTEPADGLASVGCASTFVGRLDGVNEAGVAIGFAGVPTEADRPGLMWPLAIRAVLDSCESTREATSFLESVPHVRNVNFLVADEAGEIAIVEASPERVEVVRPDDGWAAATRQFSSSTMREHQATDALPRDCARYAAIEDRVESGNGRMDVESVQRLLGDPEDGVAWRIDDFPGDDFRATIWSWAMNLDRAALTLSSHSPATTAYEPIPFPGNAGH